MDKATVVCVYKKGKHYDSRYVRRLYDDVIANGARKFLCLTDDPTVGYICPILPLEHNYRGWWSKLELFKLTDQSYVYFDLDTIIKDDITPILTHPHSFSMLKGLSGTGRPASGIMAWNGDYSHILKSFKRKHMTEYTTPEKWGDQGFIADHLGFEPDYLQDIFPSGFIVSRKYASKEERQNATIVCYHGNPRPHQTGWAI